MRRVRIRFLLATILVCSACSPFREIQNSLTQEDLNSELLASRQKQPRLAVTSAPQTLLVNQCSAVFTIQSQTSRHVPLNVSSELKVNLTPSLAVNLFSDSGCTNPLAAVVIPFGNNATQLYFKGLSAGSLVLGVSSEGYLGTSQTEIINPMPESSPSPNPDPSRPVEPSPQPSSSVSPTPIPSPSPSIGPILGGVDVTKYGAIPNDSVDDITAIEGALNSVSSGGTLFFPNGVYYISRAIRITKSGIKVSGASQSGAVIKFMGSLQSWMMALNNVSAVELSYLTLDGNFRPNVEIAVGASTGSRHFLHHLTIRNLGEPFNPNLTGTVAGGNLGIHFTADVTDSEISDNVITNAGPNTEWGGGIRVSWRSSRNKILRNLIQNTGRGGIFCNDDGEDVVIQNNVVSGSGLQKNAPALGIEVWGRCHRSIIEDNRLDHWLSIDGCDQVAVRRNVLSDPQRLKAVGLEYVAAVGGVFTDNTIESGSQVCLSASNLKRKDFAYWGYNRVNYCGTWGAQFQGENEGANYHYFYRTEFLNTGKANTSPPLYAGEGHGFRFNGNTNYVTFEQNIFSGNSGAGIQGSGSHVSILDSQITNNSSAFTNLNGGLNFEFLNNLVSGNGNNQVPLTTANLPQRPAIAINSPSVVPFGSTVTFTLNFTSYSGAPLKQVLWDFNDGVPNMTATATHLFSKRGTFRVTLVVWDTNGRSSRVEKSVTVN